MGRRNRDKRKGSGDKKQSPPDQGRRDNVWDGPIPPDAVQQFDSFLKSRRTDSRLEEVHVHHDPNYPRAPTPPRFVALRERQRRRPSPVAPQSPTAATTAPAPAVESQVSRLQCPCQICKEEVNEQTVEEVQQQDFSEVEQISMTVRYNPETSPVSPATDEGAAPVYSEMVRSLSEQIARGELRMTRYVGLYTFQDRTGNKQHVTAAVDLAPPSELQMGGRMVPVHHVQDAGPSASEEESHQGEESPANEAHLAVLEGRTLASVAQYLRETESHAEPLAEESSPQQPRDRPQRLPDSSQSTQPHLPVVVVPGAEPLNDPYHNSVVDLTPVYSGDIYQHYAQPQAGIATPYGNGHPFMVPHGAEPLCTAYQHPNYTYQIPAQTVIVQPQAMDLRYYQTTNDATYQQVSAHYTNVSWSNYSKSAESGPSYHVEAPGYYSHVQPEATYEMDAGHGYPAWDLSQTSQCPMDGTLPYTYVPQVVGPAPYAPPFAYGGHFYALNAPSPRPRAIHGRHQPGRKSRGKSGEGKPHTREAPHQGNFNQHVPEARSPPQHGICGPDPWSRPPYLAEAGCYRPLEARNLGLGICGPYPPAYQPPPLSAPAVGNPPASPWLYDRHRTTPRPLVAGGRAANKKHVNVCKDNVRGQESETRPRPHAGQDKKEGGKSDKNGTENKTSSTRTDDSRSKEDRPEVAQSSSSSSSSPPKKYTKTTGWFRKRGLRGWRREGNGNQGDNVWSGAEGMTSRRISGGFHRPWMTPEREPGPSGDQRTG